MKFVDQAKIYIKAGKGGKGCVSFRREKYVEFGGPDGGDGGRGGDIYMEAVPDLNTLMDFKFKQHYKAKAGVPGMGKNRFGAAGSDLLLKAPVGTQILDEGRDQVLHDLTQAGERILLAKGGNGGWGNTRFKSSTNRAPRNALPGQPGEEGWYWLRLKLFADVGLLGMPNAGKSTLLARLTNAKPKIADYPFTTLHPQLGVVFVDAGQSFVLADIPGLIEGAAQGVGLGHRFLGHVERCKILLHLVDGTEPDIAENFHIIRSELLEYGAGLDEKRIMTVLSKSDAVDETELAQKITQLEQLTGEKIKAISGVSGAGCNQLVRELARAAIQSSTTEEMKQSDAQTWTP